MNAAELHDLTGRLSHWLPRPRRARPFLWSARAAQAPPPGLEDARAPRAVCEFRGLLFELQVPGKEVPLADHRAVLLPAHQSTGAALALTPVLLGAAPCPPKYLTQRLTSHVF